MRRRFSSIIAENVEDYISQARSGNNGSYQERNDFCFELFNFEFLSIKDEPKKIFSDLLAYNAHYYMKNKSKKKINFKGAFYLKLKKIQPKQRGIIREN